MSAKRPGDLADTVHAQLTALRSTSGTLARVPPALEEYLSHTRLHLEVAEEYRSQSSGHPVDVGGRAVIVTAGAPGAGKSTWLSTIADGHRRIDPDEIKDLLLSRALARGLLDELRSHTLRDRASVSPREVSGWVHDASTQIAQNVRRTSLRAGENIVVEGTLNWSPLISQYTEELARADYESLTVLDVEVPLATAQGQARERWWAARNDPAESLGGRFIADAAVAAYYDTAGVSACAANARALYEQGREIFDTVLVSVTGERTVQWGSRVHDGQVEALGSTPLGAACIDCGTVMTEATTILTGRCEECAERAA